jgi:hypothetical protein
MTNTIKQTLNDRLEVVTQELAALAAEKSSRTIERVKEEFQDAMMFLPEVELKVAYYDTVYFNFDGKEILSIQNKGGYGGREKTYYLNTYSTWIEDDFELKRLVFNGLVASRLLANKETYSRIFAKEEVFEEKVGKFQEELMQLQHAVREIEHKEAKEAKEAAMKKFLAGEEIEFDERKVSQYARGKWDVLNRVTKMKCLSYDKKKNAATVEFTCQAWVQEDPDKMYTYQNIKMKYLDYFIH